MTGAFDAARALRPGLDDRQQAWAFIREFAAEWTMPLTPGDGVSAAALHAAEQVIGAGAPAALREAYRLFGQRADLTAVQDRLVPPGRLGFDSSGTMVVFRIENQNCAAWAVAVADLGHDGPPVYVRAGGRWEPFLDHVSAACVEMVLSEVLLGHMDLGDMWDLTAGLTTMIESAYEQLAVPGYPAWYDPAITVRWFSAPGKLLRMDGHGPGGILIASGKTPADLEYLRATIPGAWNSVQWPDRESR